MAIQGYYSRILERGEISVIDYPGPTRMMWWNLDQTETEEGIRAVVPMWEIASHWSMSLHDVQGSPAPWTEAVESLIDSMSEQYLAIEQHLLDDWGENPCYLTLIFQSLPAVLPADDPAVPAVGMVSYCHIGAVLSEYPPNGGWMLEGRPFRTHEAIPPLEIELYPDGRDGRVSIGQRAATMLDRAAMGRMDITRVYSVVVRPDLTVEMAPKAIGKADAFRVWRYREEAEAQHMMEYLHSLTQEELINYINTGSPWPDRLTLLLTS